MTLFGHILVMDYVSTTDLKAHLSKHLRTVREGGAVVITSHRQPVARLVSEPTHAARPVRPPRKPLAGLGEIPGVQPRETVDPVNYLIEDRRER